MVINLFMLVNIAKENKTIAIDYREMAPSKAKKNIFLDENGDAVEKLSGCSEGIPPHRVASVANNPGDTCALEVTAYTVEVITGYKTGESTTRHLGATTLYLAPDSCELLEE